MIKMVFCAKRRASVSVDEFYDYWLNQHGPLVKSKANDLQIRRYVQSHTQQEELGNMAAASRGMLQAGFDGIAEVWWDSFEAFGEIVATEAGLAASMVLAEDEEKFIDMAASTIFFTEEHEVVPFS